MSFGVSLASVLRMRSRNSISLRNQERLPRRNLRVFALSLFSNQNAFEGARTYQEKRQPLGWRVIWLCSSTWEVKT